MHGSLTRRLLVIMLMALSPLTIIFPAMAAPPVCADLAVTDFYVSPATPTAGQPATINIQVTNQGTCGTNVGFVVQWKQTQWAKTGPSASMGPLATGASQSIALPYTFTKGGNFLSVVKIDTDRTVAETNEQNNLAIYAVSVTPSTVDLIITNFTVNPNPVGQGLDAHASVTIQNTGNTDSAAFQVAWTPAANTPPITQNVPGLTAGASTTISLLYNYPDLGTFATWVVVDATHLVPETNEFNNFAFSSETVIPALPDLEVTSVTLNPAAPISGQNVHVTVTVHNAGNISTGKNFTVQWKPKPYGTPALSQQVAALDAGASENAEFDYQYTSDGTFNSVATVDSNNVVYELDEGNNSLTQPVTVGAANIDLTITNVVVTPANPEQGVNATVAVTVLNQGNDDAGPFIVSWNPDTNGVIIPSPATLTLQVPSLASGASTTVNFTYNYPQFGPFHTVATVDAFSQIKETNETNNTFIKDLVVNPGNTNLTIQSFSIDPGSGVLKRFQKATATIVVKNTGTLAVGYFKIQWKLIDSNTSGPSTWFQGLNPGQSITVTLTGTYFQPGTYNTVATVDATNVIVETNEGDNSITINGFVVKPTT